MTAYLKIILRSFLFRKRRTLLTVLGITIGATLILTLVLLGEGLKSALVTQLSAFGSDLIFVSPGKQDSIISAFLSGGQQLKDQDLRVVQDTPGVALAMGEQVKDFRVEYNGEKKVVNVIGGPWRETRAIFSGSQGFQIDKGDWPARDELDEVVLGRLAATTRFSRTIQVGEELTIGNKRFLVAGTLKSLGNSDDDSRIYMSLDRLRALTGERTGMMIIMAKAEPGTNVKHVASDIQYNLERKNSGDFTVFTSDNALEIVGNVLGIVQLVLGAFAAVALVVGGVNIMNTMFTSVLERTREVGVMKALGATDRSILLLFLSEAGLLGAFGGIIGLAISYLFAKAIEFAAASQSLSILKIHFDPFIVLGTLVFTFVIGAVFGAIPAWRASRLRPAEALRYE